MVSDVATRRDEGLITDDVVLRQTSMPFPWFISLHVMWSTLFRVASKSPADSWGSPDFHVDNLLTP